MKVLTVVLAATVLVPLAGCGDDEDDRLDRAGFVEAANAICLEEGSAVEEAGDEVFAEGEPDGETVRAFLEDTAIPRVEAMVDRIEELEPPEEMEGDVDELTDATRGAIEELRAAAESDDPMALFTGEDPFTESDALALELGLAECSDDDDEDGEDG